MRYAIRAPLLHILHTSPSPLGRLGADFRSFHPVDFPRLRNRSQGLRQEVGNCGELFAKCGGEAPLFEGGDTGEEDEGALVGKFSLVYRGAN